MASSLKALAREPLWSAIAILTLALGIGVNAAIFSVVQAVLLRSLPFPQAERLVLLYQQNATESSHRGPVTPADYFDWRRLNRSFSGITTYSIASVDATLSGKGETLLVRQLHVDGDFFDVLGAGPALGKPLRLADALTPEAPVVVLSDHLWRELGSNPRLVGQSLVINGVPHEVRGVMAAGFAFPNGDIDLWTPLLWPTLPRDEHLLRQIHTLRVVGKLRPDISLSSARSDLKTLAARQARSFPESNGGETADLMPLRDWLVRDLRLSLLLLWATSGLVLLIACANVASLQVMRGLTRARELATHVALGAPRGALLRRSFFEILILALCGGLLGFVASDWATSTLLSVFPGELPRFAQVSADFGVATFTALLSAGSALLSGILPAYYATRRVVADALKLGGPATPGPGRSRSLMALLVVETALTAILLLGVSFLVRSLFLLREVDLGFQPRGILTLELALPASRYPTEPQMAGFYQRLLEEVRRVPGVESAAVTDALPLSGLRWEGQLEIEGAGSDAEPVTFHHRIVSPDYFQTFGVRQLRGGSVPATTGPGGAAVVMNQNLARRCFGDANPIGRRVRFKRQGVEDSGWLAVAGVVGAERIEGIAADPGPDLFESYLQDSERRIRLAVRSSLPREPLLRELRRIGATLDPSVPFARPRSMEDIVGASTANERFLLALMGSLALLAVALAGVGIYAVTAYSVARRQREIGIRLALGATQPQVQRALIGESMRAVALGGLLGLLPALGLIRLLRDHLFGLAPTDVTAIVQSAAALGVVTILPAYLAARRAGRIGPTLPIREG